VAAGAGIAAFLVSCAAARGGFFSSVDPGDVVRYHEFARNMQDGQLPYRDFYMEYPPGAIGPFLAPVLVKAVAGYNLAFKLTVAAAGVGAIAATSVLLRLLQAERLRAAATYATIAVTPAALGAVVLNRYDLWPALITAGAVAAILAARDRLGFGLLAVGCAVKLYPLVALPVILVHVARTRGRDALSRGLKSFAVVLVVCVLPFAILAPGGLRYSFKTQVVRHLQLESLPSSVLLAAKAVGVYSASIVPGKPGSLDLSGTLPNALGVLTTLVLLAALGLVVVAYVRAEESTETLVVGIAASITAFVAFSKVISPQFLVWLVPVVPLVARRRGLVASSVLITALIATQIEVVYEHPLRAFGWPVWVLLARNVLLVALFVLLLGGLHERRHGVDDQRQVLDRREPVVGAVELEDIV
jgi:Glycosyltransferase family 87